MARFTIDTDAKKIIVLDTVFLDELNKFVEDCNLHGYLITSEPSPPLMRVVPLIDPIIEQPKIWPTPPFYPDIMYCNA